VSRTSQRTGRWRRPTLPAAAVLLTVAAAIGRSFLRRRPLVELVVADLRTPILYLPMSLRSEGVLRALRSLPAPVLSTPPQVEVGSRTITTDAGDQLRVVTTSAPIGSAREAPSCGSTAEAWCSVRPSRAIRCAADGPTSSASSS
jgi:hypothetical protein